MYHLLRFKNTMEAGSKWLQRRNFKVYWRHGLPDTAGDSTEKEKQKGNQHKQRKLKLSK